MRAAALIFGMTVLTGGTAVAAPTAVDPQAVVLTLKDHRFDPRTVTVAADRPIRIELINRDPASEEFDSEDLHVEKEVTPNGRVSFTVGPLKPGTYSFMGELHADTASGEIKVVEAPREAATSPGR